jgi:hypothetical protein
VQKLNVKLENCYGIKRLEHEFDFSKGRTIAIYAPNGVMKTSFAKTLKDISIGKKPCDLMDANLHPVFDVISDDTGSQISSQDIFVIEPYNEKSFNSEDKILTLLANEELRNRYLTIYKELDDHKKALITALKNVSGSNNCEFELLESFPSLNDRNIYEVFEAIFDNIQNSKQKFSFRYNDVFDPSGKVKDFLEKNIDLFKQYIERYEDLIGKSDFFAKHDNSVFGTTEAKSIRDSLEGDDFFIAGHKLNLKSYGEVDTEKRFAEILGEEIEKIFNDEDLKKIFEKIDKSLDANKELRAFKKVVEKDVSILVWLVDYDSFRQEVWFSFLKQLENELVALIKLYNSKKAELKLIIQETINERSKWTQAIEEFENRFVNVPFSLEIKNKEDVVLNAKTPTIDFVFSGKSIKRDGLLQILSQGERRAFYLLNIIFEIKSLQLKNQKTLFIIDDIADSFDYKNKYAIVEYLNDISKDNNFHSIILTHNFDFFRTIQSRILQNRWKNSFIAEKTDDEIKLMCAGNKNVFDPFKTWREEVNDNKKYLIAAVPFVRNLIEFSKGSENNDYLLLTHVLHDKREDPTKPIKDSINITISDLEPIFAKVLSAIRFNFPDKNTKKITELIEEIAKEIYEAENPDCIVLEDKIILSIATRLKAERYMWSKITDQSPIKGSQTGHLFGRFKDEFKLDPTYEKTLMTLERVNIMTPENIHLNSFMYEPILDMGVDELKNVYKDIYAL